MAVEGLASHPYPTAHSPTVGCDPQPATHPQLGLHNHQVAVQGLVGDGAQRIDNQRADGDVGHKAPVHHVHMHPVTSSLVDGLDLQAPRRMEGTTIGAGVRSSCCAGTQGAPGLQLAIAQHGWQQCQVSVPGQQKAQHTASLREICLRTQAGVPPPTHPGAAVVWGRRPTCSPSLAKLADRIEGATYIAAAREGAPIRASNCRSQHVPRK